MIDEIIKLDTKLFLYLNSFHSDFFDPIISFMSDSKIPILILTLILVFSLIYKYRKAFIVPFLFGILSVGASDAITSGFMKPTFKRLRPCMEPSLKEKVHVGLRNCWGGKYGFASSHAANTFAMATFFFILLKSISKFFILLFPYATFISYTRIYLAKHYPLDLIFGALVGVIISLIFLKIFNLVYRRFFIPVAT